MRHFLAAFLVLTTLFLAGTVRANVDDSRAWFEGLPAELRFDTALAAAKSDEHMTAGTKATVTRYLDDLKALGIRL